MGAKQSKLVMASEPRARQRSAVDHDEYTKAHARYSNMKSAALKAHETAMEHVRRGLEPATALQLAGEEGY